MKKKVYFLFFTWCLASFCLLNWGFAQQMALIPGGTFRMGDVLNDSLYPDERPVKEVTVSDFYMAATETTFGEFDAFCRATGRALPSDNGWGRGDMPVFNVDWYDAVEYCNWLSERDRLKPYYAIQKDRRDPANHHKEDMKAWEVTRNPTAKGYRLPSEAEWEYAARAFKDAQGRATGGGEMRFSHDRDTANALWINFRADSVFRKSFSQTGVYRKKTVLVYSLPPNALGLFEMCGNVFEWCDDWYAERRYDQAGAPATGSTKVARGGSWFSQAAFCRVSYRFDWVANTRCTIIGFRVVRSR